MNQQSVWSSGLFAVMRGRPAKSKLLPRLVGVAASGEGTLNGVGQLFGEDTSEKRYKLEVIILSRNEFKCLSERAL